MVPLLLRRKGASCAPGLLSSRTARAPLQQSWEISRDRPRPQALQKTCIVTWMGKKENDAAAQAALLSRSKANSEACKGAYVAGSCPSIGAKGNVEMQGGAY